MHEQGNKFQLFECSIPSLSHHYSFGGDEKEMREIFNKSSDEYIPETVPDIRIIHNQAAKMDAIQSSGLESCEDKFEMPDMITLEERLKSQPTCKAENTLLKLAGCAIRQRANAFEEVEHNLESMRKFARKILSHAADVEEQLAFIKKLAVIE